MDMYSSLTGFLRRKVQDEVIEYGSKPTPRQAESINKARINLRDRITNHSKRRPRFMAQIAEQGLDNDIAGLPSTIGEPRMAWDRAMQQSRGFGVVALPPILTNGRLTVCVIFVDFLCISHNWFSLANGVV